MNVNVIKILGIKENNVMLTNPFVLLAIGVAYYPVRIIKSLYVKYFFYYKHIIFKCH